MSGWTNAAWDGIEVVDSGGGVPYADYANTVLLVHFDTADATVGKDYSSYNHTPTVVGSPVVEASPAQFGESINVFPSLNYIDWADNAAFTPGTDEPWCIDYWINFTSTTPDGEMLYHNAFDVPGPQPGELVFDITSSKPRLVINSLNILAGGAKTLTTGTWYHLAINFDGGTYRLFIDGELELSNTTSERWLDQAAPIRLRGDQDCHVDELRIVIGSKVFPDAGFVPNIVPYPNS